MFCVVSLAHQSVTFQTLSSPLLCMHSCYVRDAGSVKEELVKGCVVSLLKTPPHDVPDYGVQYLEQLLTILTQ